MRIKLIIAAVLVAALTFTATAPAGRDFFLTRGEAQSAARSSVRQTFIVRTGLAPGGSHRAVWADVPLFSEQ